MSYIDEPVSFYSNEWANPVIFHFMDVWEGLMILIVFPDQTTMLYDCNIIDENQEYIMDYLNKHMPSKLIWWEYVKNIDIFVNSHRDQDHLRGIKEINNNFPILSIWDSDQSGNSSTDYLDYMTIKRNLAKEWKVFTPTASSDIYKTIGGVQIFCLNPDKSINESEDETTDKETHINCIVLSIEYLWKRLLLTWDSWYDVWRDYIIPNFKDQWIIKSDILVASHHGSRSFFTDSQNNEDINIEENPENTYIEHIGIINPDFTIISCGDYEKNHLPNNSALQLYRESTSNEQVYTTKEKWTLQWFFDKYWNWSVIPSRFKKRRIAPGNFDFEIVCKTSGWIQCFSWDQIHIWEKLEFSIQTKWGLADIKPNVYWEVSNWWLWEHIDHDEIYYKSKEEKTPRDVFKRNVAYVWKHLLRCRVKKASTDITKIFIVNWIN